MKKLLVVVGLYAFVALGCGGSDQSEQGGPDAWNEYPRTADNRGLPTSPQPPYADPNTATPHIVPAQPLDTGNYPPYESPNVPTQPMTPTQPGVPNIAPTAPQGDAAARYPIVPLPPTTGVEPVPSLPTVPDRVPETAIPVAPPNRVDGSEYLTPPRADAPATSPHLTPRPLERPMVPRMAEPIERPTYEAPADRTVEREIIPNVPAMTAEEPRRESRFTERAALDTEPMPQRTRSFAPTMTRDEPAAPAADTGPIVERPAAIPTEPAPDSTPAAPTLPMQPAVPRIDQPTELLNTPATMPPSAGTTATSPEPTSPEPTMPEPATHAVPPPAARTAAQPTAPMPEKSPDSSGEDLPYHLVKVFYGTDRDRQAAHHIDWLDYVRHLALPCLALALAVGGGVGAYYLPARRKMLAWLGGAAGVAGLALLVSSIGSMASDHRHADSQNVVYGKHRGTLDYGICDVSIPKRHQVGELEAPSILRLELREDPIKHVVLLKVESKEEAEFYDRLRRQVAQSPKKEVLVFVHGFNVTFEAAARRTAQMAFDLEFDGAPVMFSWPSQGDVLGYTADETNVYWSVPHLKQFLIEVAGRSGARSVNLIAHSMGNRALTGALRELSFELGQQQKLFNKVVLAAPDVDAEVFKRDIAPAIAKTAEHVTLYASSNDQALVASRKVHGYPRAGESGDQLVVVAGVETIDVSSVDTSLLGHSYYGSSDSILTDLYYLLHQSLPARQRHLLVQAEREGMPYWVFQSRSASRPNAGPMSR